MGQPTGPGKGKEAEDKEEEEEEEEPVAHRQYMVIGTLALLGLVNMPNLVHRSFPIVTENADLIWCHLRPSMW